MFVLTNTSGPSIDLSTCDSAAKFIIKSQSSGILLRICGSQIFPWINSYLISEEIDFNKNVKLFDPYFKKRETKILNYIKYDCKTKEFDCSHQFDRKRGIPDIFYDEEVVKLCGMPT